MAVKQLQTSKKQLNATAEVSCANFLHWAEDHKPFNIVFIDPPFNERLWDQAINKLINDIALADGALIYFESPRDLPITIPNQWELIKHKTQTNVCARLYKTKPIDPS